MITAIATFIGFFVLTVYVFIPLGAIILGLVFAGIGSIIAAIFNGGK